MVAGPQITRLGEYTTELEAAHAYDAAMRKINPTGEVNFDTQGKPVVKAPPGGRQPAPGVPLNPREQHNARRREKRRLANLAKCADTPCSGVVPLQNELLRFRICRICAYTLAMVGTAGQALQHASCGVCTVVACNDQTSPWGKAGCLQNPSETPGSSTMPA